MKHARADLFEAINAKCQSNDRTWGGAEHDDQHSRRDWIAFIVRQLGDAERWADFIATAEYKDQLIAVAALAVQAIESVNRITEGPKR